MVSRKSAPLPSDLPDDVRERAKRMRQGRSGVNMSHTEAAEAASRLLGRLQPEGISRERIRKYEAGKPYKSLAREPLAAIALSIVYEVEPYWLVPDLELDENAVEKLTEVLTELGGDF